MRASHLQQFAGSRLRALLRISIQRSGSNDGVAANGGQLFCAELGLRTQTRKGHRVLQLLLGLQLEMREVAVNE